MGKTLSDINHNRIFYNPPPRVMTIKTKINKWDLTELNIFCTKKETISKVKRQPSEWEKIIVNRTTDKELISKIYKQLMQLNTRKMNNPIKNWAKELNRHFSKEDIQMANKHMKRCSITHYQRNTNQNHNEVSSHAGQNQFSSVQSLTCLTVRDSMNHSTPGFPVLNYLPESAQTHVHLVSDAIQSSHPVAPFSSCPQSLPASESFPMSQLFA